jgi:hypothetical protein
MSPVSGATRLENPLTHRSQPRAASPKCPAKNLLMSASPECLPSPKTGPRRGGNQLARQDGRPKAPSHHAHAFFTSPCVFPCRGPPCQQGSEAHVVRCCHLIMHGPPQRLRVCLRSLPLADLMHRELPRVIIGETPELGNKKTRPRWGILSPRLATSYPQACGP